MLSPTLLTGETKKKAKPNKLHFNPLLLLTGAEQDGSIGSRKLEAFIPRCCSWELGQVLPGDLRSCFCQWHLQGLVIRQHSPKCRAISSKRNREPSFSDTGLLHVWSPMKWGGRGLRGFSFSSQTHLYMGLFCTRFPPLPAFHVATVCSCLLRTSHGKML